MEKEIHDIIVYLVVGIILIFQIKVFLGNYRKIQDYKNTIQQSNKFEMVEVFVDENEVDKIDAESLIIEFYEQQKNKNGQELKSSAIETSKNTSPGNTGSEKANNKIDARDLSSLNKEEVDELERLFHVPTSERTKDN